MPSRRLLWGSFLFYCAFIVYGTTIPFSVDLQQVQPKWEQFRAHPLLPEDPSIPDMVSNILLFVPFGFLLAGLRCCSVSYPASRIDVILTALLGAFFFSTTVEICQLALPSRTSSLVDILTNTGGSLLGAIAGLVFFRNLYIRVELFLRDQLATKPMALLLFGFVGCQIVGALFPFDVSIDISDFKEHLKTINLYPFAYNALVNRPGVQFSMANFGENLILYALFGFMLVLCFNRYWKLETKAWIKVLGLGLLLPPLVELLKLLINSRYSDINDVLSGWMGIFLGAFWCAVISPGGKAETMPLSHNSRRLKHWMFLYGLLLIVMTLNPFSFSFSPDSFSNKIEWQLFWSYYSNTNFWALKDILTKVLLGMPIGLYVGHRLNQAGSKLILIEATVIGLGVGILLELSQIFVDTRYPSVTDVLSYGMGSYLGAAGAVYYRRVVPGQYHKR
jgi:glycopeptide antibiotics resistance protein